MGEVEVKGLDDPKASIRKGFKWIGIGSMVSQSFDAVSFFIVMLFITKSDMGLATLAVGFSAFVEAFNSMGVNVAFLQDANPTEDETHSLFWFSSGFGIFVFLLSIPLSMGISAFYGVALLLPLLLASFAKTIFVCIGEIPLQLINRRFDFHQISLTQMIATFLCSITKIVLAFLGFGAWSLVLANTLYGVISCSCSIIFSKFRPKLHFRRSECTRFMKFGIKHCVGSSIEQLNKNLHYFVIGKFCGESLLGVYRVAFEFAMTPALALFRIVNKSSFPIFAKIKSNRNLLSELFAWNQKNIAIFCAVPMVFIYYCAVDVFTLQGIPAWFEALVFIAPVLMISLLRSLSQTFPELYRACGSPERSLYIASAETLLSLLLFPLVLFLVDGSMAIRIMLGVWILLFIALLIVHYHFAKRYVNLTPFSIPRSFMYAFGYFALCFIPCEFLTHYRDALPFNPWLHLIGQVLLMSFFLWLYAKKILNISFKFKKQVAK
ncbi:MAG: oligosaccharide flippase family protein [Bradymonadales bacterium]